MACIVKRRNRWIIDFYDNQGRRRWKTLPKGTTKTKARESMRDIEDQLARGVWMPDKRKPAFIEAAKDWLETKRPNVRESTLEMYRGHLVHHFEELKHLRVDRITTAVVEKLILDRQNRGMNRTTLKKLIVTLNQVMNYCVRHKYIDHNPVRDAQRPKSQGGAVEKSIDVLTTEEINHLLEETKTLKYKTLFMLAIMSGMRQGELLGLKWADMDWDNSQIHVQRSYNKGRWYLPKSKKSDRRIDLGPAMMKQLRMWRMACPPNDLDLIFPNNVGKPMCQSHMLSRYFFPALNAAGIKRIRFHDLRHTYASLLINQGENIKYIQEQLGHSSPTMTLDVYAHLMSPINQKAARRLEDQIFETIGSKMVAKNKKGATVFTVKP